MRGKRQTGQSLAELALLMPLLMLILMGCLDLGRAFAMWINLANVAREGARYACLHPDQVDGFDNPYIREAVQAEIEAEGLDYEAVTLSASLPSGTVTGYPVIVTVHCKMPLISGYLFGGHPVGISASAQMAIVEGG